MGEALREFFGFGGYQRQPEGAYSWQHLTFVGSMILVMIVLAILLGLRNRHRPDKVRNRVIIVSAILIDAFEIAKIVIVGIKDPGNLLNVLPLFTCSISLFALPLAAFAKGRIREASLDFMFIFGLLLAVFGTIGAAQNYSAYPVLAWDNVVSGITHSISGFSSLYIGVSGMMSMKKKNIWITFLILFIFSAAAYVADVLIPYNYMFLMRGDGTPYDIFYNLVNGNRVLYPSIVVGLFVLWMVIFYAVYYLITKKKASRD
ncbi:MAG: YwaF family protein [Clostridia bacterium]|nr:YwaF family protein [Clostridia bacterium]